MSEQTVNEREAKCFSCAHYVDQKCINHSAKVRGFGDQRGWLYWPLSFSVYAIKCQKGYQVRK